MSDDTELKITIDPDEPIVDEAAAKADPKVEAKVEKPTEPAVDELKSQVTELTEGREAERKRREAAEQEAQQLRREAEQAHQRATDSDLSTVLTAIESEQEKIDQAKRDIKLAKDAGDVDAETDAIDRLTTAKATFLRLDETKADAEARKKAPPKREAPSRDPVEAYVTGRTAPTAAWIRQHPEYVTDARKNDKLTAAHYDAVAEGYSPDSKRYFDHVEKYLGMTQDDPNEASKPKPETKRAASAPVAPAAAVANGGTAPAANEVRLTAGEARSATDGTIVHNMDDPKGKFKKGDPIGIIEMGRRKLAMTKQGRYDRSFVDS